MMGNGCKFNYKEYFQEFLGIVLQKLDKDKVYWLVRSPYSLLPGIRTEDEIEDHQKTTKLFYNIEKGEWQIFDYKLIADDGIIEIEIV
jgi:hypothetical protein